jgi:hypothetical protein
MTIKTQGGKVITKGGKVSCECCEEGPCDGCSLHQDIFNFSLDFVSGSADLYFFGDLIDNNFWSYDSSEIWEFDEIPRIQPCRQAYGFRYNYLDEFGDPNFDDADIAIFREKQEGKCGYRIRLEVGRRFEKSYFVDSCLFDLNGAGAVGQIFIADQNMIGTHSFSSVVPFSFFVGFDDEDCPEDLPLSSVNGFTAQITITN